MTKMNFEEYEIKLIFFPSNGHATTQLNTFSSNLKFPIVVEVKQDRSSNEDDIIFEAKSNASKKTFTIKSDSRNSN